MLSKHQLAQEVILMIANFKRPTCPPRRIGKEGKLPFCAVVSE